MAENRPSFKTSFKEILLKGSASKSVLEPQYVNKGKNENADLTQECKTTSNSQSMQTLPVCASGASGSQDFKRTGSSCLGKQPIHSKKAIRTMQRQLKDLSWGPSEKQSVSYKATTPLDYRKALMKNLPEKKPSEVFHPPPKYYTDNFVDEALFQVDPDQVLPSTNYYNDNNNTNILKRHVDSVVFNPENIPVLSLTLKSDICRTCGLFKYNERDCCDCSWKRIVRPSRWQIWSHPIVQKNLEENGWSDPEEVDASSEVVQIMNLAATFVPYKDRHKVNRTYKIPPLK